MKQVLPNLTKNFPVKRNIDHPVRNSIKSSQSLPKTDARFIGVRAAEVGRGEKNTDIRILARAVARGWKWKEEH